jgi:hypothetical protein
MSDTFARPEPASKGHPTVGPALDITGDTVAALQRLDVPEIVIVDVLLQEVIWILDRLDPASAEAERMRGIIGWFSDECSSLVGPPDLSRLGRLKNKIVA